MNSQQQLTVWLGSFRYYLGLQTCTVSEFCKLLIQEWPQLPDSVKSLIKKELAEEFQRDSDQRIREVDVSFLPLGHNCDRASWQEVLNFVNSTPEQP